MEPFNFFIFGVTGHLAQNKILPALENLKSRGNLPEKTSIIGIGRRENFGGNLEYLRGDFSDDELYRKIKDATKKSASKNNIFYLATYPSLYALIFANLKKMGLTDEKEGYSRIIIEKPIGADLSSAKVLNNLMRDYFTDKQIYRIDHYLGKESLRNLYDSKFEPTEIKNIQVSVLEKGGVDGRGEYYEQVGALKDVGQNHILQMLASVIPDSPETRAEAISSLESDPKKIIFGQYSDYKKEEEVSPTSETDTYFSLEAQIISGPFKGIPVYLRSGKKMHESVTKIDVVLKSGKVETFKMNDPEAYEKLIMETANGNSKYFVGEKEVEAEWNFIDPLTKNRTNPVIYKEGSLGPKDNFPWV